MSRKRTRLHALDWVLSEHPELTEGKRVLFMGAEYHPMLQRLQCTELLCQQTFFPFQEELQSNGLAIPATVSGTFDCILIAGTKTRAANNLALKEATAFSDDNTTILFVLESDLGGGSYVKFLKTITTNIEVLSKARCKIAIFPCAALRAVLQAFSPPQIPEISFQGISFRTHPSLFSWQEPDKGSQLLLDHIPPLAGKGADFGCGWGMLGVSLLERYSEITEVTFIDAQREALDCVERTMKGLQSDRATQYIHEDLTKRSNILSQYEWIVSNLPFHTANTTDMSLQGAFVQTILGHLLPSGKAYLLWHHREPRTELDPWKSARDMQILHSRPPFFVVELAR